MAWRVIILLFLAICNAALFFKMIWGSTGIMEYRSLKKQYATLQKNISQLDAENMALSRDIRLMQTDGKYAEKMIRQKLHYLRNNEIVYLFKNPVDNSYGANPNDGKN